jgi:hypothetical protein
MSDPVREAFEAWHRSKFGYQTDLCGEERYVSSRAHTLWEAWQASRAAALEEAASECDAEASIEGIAQRCAARIRAMVKP